MDEEALEGEPRDEAHREDDPDALDYGGAASWVHRLKDELFNDLTTEDVCYITGLDKSTVLRYLKEGTIEGYQLGRSWRVPPESLRKFKEHLLSQARTAAAEVRLERQCELLQMSDPGAGWETARCPNSNGLILVKDELEIDADAWNAGIEQYIRTGRKVGHCEMCSWPYEGQHSLVEHTFGERTAPEQQVP